MVIDNSIAFPGLGLKFDPSRTINQDPIFGRYFYWYGAILALGFLLAALYCLYRAKDFRIKKDDVVDMLFFATPAAIIFARLYYVVFNFEIFRDDPISILYIWDGGIAMYGSIIGALIAVALFCRVKKIHIGAMLDLGAMGLLIGQIIGRWGNFINRECHGTETTLPWGMEITVGINQFLEPIRQIVHPTFLYESLWNLIGLIIIALLCKKRKFNGEMFLIYVVWYGLGRGVVEGLRTDSLMFFNTGLRVSQALAFISMFAALVALFYKLVLKATDNAVLEAYYGTVPAPEADVSEEGADALEAEELEKGESPEENVSVIDGDTALSEDESGQAVPENAVSGEEKTEDIDAGGDK